MSDVDGTSPLVDDDEEGGENDPAVRDGDGHAVPPDLVELHEVLEWEAAKTKGPTQP